MSGTAPIWLSNRPVFVSGQGGYHTYRIPSLIVTSKGTVLAFCEGRKNGRGDAGDIDLLLRRSLDGGKTWEKTQVVWDDGPNTCGNPCPVIDAKTGTIWLLLTHNLGGDTESEDRRRHQQGHADRLGDQERGRGRHLEPAGGDHRRGQEAGLDLVCHRPGVGIQLRSGRLVVPCDNMVAGSKVQQSHVIFSDDGGQTWKLGGVVGPAVRRVAGRRTGRRPADAQHPQLPRRPPPPGRHQQGRRRDVLRARRGRRPDRAGLSGEHLPASRRRRATSCSRTRPARGASG